MPIGAFNWKTCTLCREMVIDTEMKDKFICGKPDKDGLAYTLGQMPSPLWPMRSCPLVLHHHPPFHLKGNQVQGQCQSLSPVFSLQTRYRGSRLQDTAGEFKIKPKGCHLYLMGHMGMTEMYNLMCTFQLSIYSRAWEMVILVCPLSNAREVIAQRQG